MGNANVADNLEGNPIAFSSMGDIETFDIFFRREINLTFLPWIRKQVYDWAFIHSPPLRRHSRWKPSSRAAPVVCIGRTPACLCTTWLSRAAPYPPSRSCSRDGPRRPCGSPSALWHEQYVTRVMTLQGGRERGEKHAVSISTHCSRPTTKRKLMSWSLRWLHWMVYQSTSNEHIRL